MRVVIAPDGFTGTLSAVEAAEAIAAGWRRRAPDDDLVLVPMSDGGPGFGRVLAEVLHGTVHTVEVPAPLPHLDPVRADIVMVGTTAYLESAHAVGLDLVPEAQRDATRASSIGLGVLIAAALDAGATTVVVGLGGTGTNDGGLGMLLGLGAHLDGTGATGPAAMAEATSLDLAPARERLAGVTLIAATDVDNPLLGLTGATKTFGPQKGLDDNALLIVDGWLQRLAELTDRKLADTKGAGAGGGIGFGLALLGARRVPGVEMIAEAVRLAEQVATADLVITGEGAFDFSSRAGKVPYGVAEIAAEALAPCIVLAGQVLVSSREMRAMGIEAAYSMVDLVGADRSFGEPRAALADLAARVARTWARR